MRAFIAIELSEKIRESLAQIQTHLKYSASDVKWIEKNNIHLTLKFLGEIDEKRLPGIIAALETIARESRPFEISIKDIGVFPNINYPRVIWVGLDKGAVESKALADNIDGALSKTGFQKEPRPFTAHLTIGRVRSPKNKEVLKQKLMSLPLKEPNSRRAGLNLPYGQLVASIILFQSTLTPKGSIYTKLHESSLRGGL